MTGAGLSAAGAPTRHYRRLVADLDDTATVTTVTAEQSNSSVTVADRVMLKFVRRLEAGANPGVEVGRYLDERAGFDHVPRVAGSLELAGRWGGTVPAHRGRPGASSWRTRGTAGPTSSTC